MLICSWDFLNKFITDKLVGSDFGLIDLVINFLQSKFIFISHKLNQKLNNIMSLFGENSKDENIRNGARFIGDNSIFIVSEIPIKIISYTN